MRNKKDIKYIALLVSTVVIFILIEFLTPKPIDWTITLSKKDKIPFGTYVLHNLLNDFTNDKDISHSYSTLYELQNQISADQTIFILSKQFAPDQIDTDVLLNKVDSGAIAFISAQYFSGKLADTLNIQVKDDLLSTGLEENLSQKDTTQFHLVNPLLVDLPSFKYQKNHFPTYFSSVDSSKSTIFIRDRKENVLGISINHGKGTLYLSTIPLAFTNTYLLSKENDQSVAGLLSYLPEKDIFWTEYYHLGRMESGSPIRFILKTPSLRMAYYVTFVTLLLFLFFEAKRKQRIIPIVKPYTNTSLEFVGVISNLYLQNNNHKKIAHKRIAFFLEQVRQLYFINKIEYSDSFYEILAAKSGNKLKGVKSLFNIIENIQKQSKISADNLRDLSIKIDQFLDHK